MTIAEIRMLFAYNQWANRRVLDSVAAVPAEEFTRDLGSSFGSLRDTLVHMLSAEWIWLMRWKGTSPKNMLVPGDFPTFGDVVARWQALEREQSAFISGLGEEDLARRVRYVNTQGEQWAYPLWEMLCHVVNHASYHRGQIATMLRQLARVPASTDLLVFRDVIGPEESAA